MTVLAVEVIGIPAPQGSKSYKGHRNGRPVLVESSKAVRPWRLAVAWEVRYAMARQGWTLAEGPVGVDIAFYLPRPRSVSKSRHRPHVMPDLDKLVRATFDGLTESGCIRDDALIVDLTAGKHYATDWTGARINIRTIDGSPS